MVRAERHARSGKPSDALSAADAYAILGVDETCSDTELKRAYRWMMNRHRPDKLVAKGLPEEMPRVATERRARSRPPTIGSRRCAASEPASRPPRLPCGRRMRHRPSRPRTTSRGRSGVRLVRRER